MTGSSPFRDDDGPPLAAGPGPPPPWRPQFGLRALLAAMLLFSFMSASLAGMLEGSVSGILIALLAPMGLMMAVSLVVFGMALWKRSRRRSD
jgi:hypothetical protein